MRSGLGDLPFPSRPTRITATPPSTKPAATTTMGRRTTALSRSIPTKGSKDHPRHLLSLPGEIRNTIFRYVLAQHHDQSATLSLLSDISDHKVFRPSPQQPALARTCRQLRHEVLSIFFGERTFEVDRELGMRDRIATWSRVMRPSLFFLRSIRFELFSEYTAGSKELQTGLCDVVVVDVWMTDDNSIDYRIASGGEATCECKFNRVARDVRRGILGSPRDAPLIRFLKAWDIERPPLRGDRFMVCSSCGGGGVQVSLRDIRRGSSLPS